MKYEKIIFKLNLNIFKTITINQFVLKRKFICLYHIMSESYKSKRYNIIINLNFTRILYKKSII